MEAPEIQVYTKNVGLSTLYIFCAQDCGHYDPPCMHYDVITTSSAYLLCMKSSKPITHLSPLRMYSTAPNMILMSIEQHTSTVVAIRFFLDVSVV